MKGPVTSRTRTDLANVEGTLDGRKIQSIHPACDRKSVPPTLGRIEGHRGAYLLRRTVGAAIEIVVFTLWDSMDAIRRFAGIDPEKAVVEPEARMAMTEC